jgi:hypothetical protein
MFWRRDASFRLLLKSMKHVDNVGEAHRVDGPVGVAVEIGDNFKDAPAAEALQRFRRVWFVSTLCLMQGMANATPDLVGERL